MKAKSSPWRGSPRKPTEQDNRFMEYLLAGVRAKREEATGKAPAALHPPKAEGES
jgi:hypothetical protein